MIDFTTEHVFRLRDAATFLGVKYGTVHRWVTKGHKGRLLESAALGGVVFTSKEAIQRFSGQATNGLASPKIATIMPAEHFEAMRSLARRGALPRPKRSATEKC